MKKLLLLFALAALAACNTEDEKGDSQSVNFAGTLSVSSVQTPSATPFVMTDVHFELSDGNKGLLNLTMHEIRFATSMPMSLNIVIPDLDYADNDGDGIFELTSTADPIIPYIGGKPYFNPATGDGFEIADFKATLADGRLSVSFICRNPKIPVGAETLDHKAEYHGSILL